ncbi:MAG: transposase [Acidobacteriia bacterium]|nr:transposase [Terriglobia bacterium]
MATERLSLLPDGRLLSRLKRRRHNGTTRMIFELRELIEKLAAPVPPRRFDPGT